MEREIRRRVEIHQKSIFDRLEKILSPDEYRRVLEALAEDSHDNGDRPVARF
jgi:hypothetical protein